MNKLILLLLIFSANVFANDYDYLFREEGTVGNGGDAVVCRDSNDKIISAELLDYYEARFLRGEEILIKDSESLTKVASEILSLLNISETNLFVRYTNDVHDMLNKNSLFKKGINLVDVPDSRHLAFPRGCNVEQVVISKKIIFPEDKKYLVNEDIWERLPFGHKVGLLIHEAIYNHFLELGENNSLKVRYFNSKIAYLYSKGELNLKNYLNLVVTLDLWDWDPFERSNRPITSGVKVHTLADIGNANVLSIPEGDCYYKTREGLYYNFDVFKENFLQFSKRLYKDLIKERSPKECPERFVGGLNENGVEIKKGSRRMNLEYTDYVLHASINHKKFCDGFDFCRESKLDSLAEHWFELENNITILTFKIVNSYLLNRDWVQCTYILNQTTNNVVSYLEKKCVKSDNGEPYYGDLLPFQNEKVIKIEYDSLDQIDPFHYGVSGFRFASSRQPSYLLAKNYENKVFYHKNWNFELEYVTFDGELGVIHEVVEEIDNKKCIFEYVYNIFVESNILRSEDEYIPVHTRLIGVVSVAEEAETHRMMPNKYYFRERTNDKSSCHEAALLKTLGIDRGRAYDNVAYPDIFINYRFDRTVKDIQFFNRSFSVLK